MCKHMIAMQNLRRCGEHQYVQSSIEWHVYDTVDITVWGVDALQPHMLPFLDIQANPNLTRKVHNLMLLVLL